MSRLSFSDDALERVEDLLDAAPPVYSNGIGDLPPAEREAVLARIVEERHYADGEVESIRVVGEAAGANVRMTKPWTPRTEGGEALRFFVVVDERDIDVGDDGVQIDEIDLISTPIPTIEVTYADGRTEKIEAA